MPDNDPGLYAVESLLDLSQTRHPEIFNGCRYPWELFSRLPEIVLSILAATPDRYRCEGAFVGPEVVVGEGTVVEPGATIKGPAVIGRNCEIRAGAYIRENVLVGDGCVLGNSCEFKNSVMFNGVQVPHFSYVGDSLLGFKAHLGAGAILSNVKSVGGPVVVRGETVLDTGLAKFGAILADFVEVGCNCIINPGSVIGRRSLLYPGVSWRGVCPADSIVKLRQEQIVVHRR